MNHITRIVRLNFANRWTIVGLPSLIMAFVFLVNLVIWAILVSSLSGESRAQALHGTGFSGSTFYIFVYLLVLAIQVVNITFPVALGFGATRRDFYLGSALTWVILSLGYGGALTVLSFIEQATGGWGFGGHMFTAVYFGEGPWYQRLFIFAGGLLFFFFIGTAAATVFVRWRAIGLTVLGAGFLLVVLLAVAAVTLTDSWAAIGNGLANAGTVGIVGWLMVPTLVAAILGFLVLSRATPKS